MYLISLLLLLLSIIYIIKTGLSITPCNTIISPYFDLLYVDKESSDTAEKQGVE